MQSTVLFSLSQTSFRQLRKYHVVLHTTVVIQGGKQKECSVVGSLCIYFADQRQHDSTTLLSLVLRVELFSSQIARVTITIPNRYADREWQAKSHKKPKRSNPRSQGTANYETPGCARARVCVSLGSKSLFPPWPSRRPMLSGTVRTRIPKEKTSQANHSADVPSLYYVGISLSLFSLFVFWGVKHTWLKKHCHIFST